jgi:hypothetical protein
VQRTVRAHDCPLFLRRRRATGLSPCDCLVRVRRVTLPGAYARDPGLAIRRQPQT